MTKREKAKALRLLDETEKEWREGNKLARDPYARCPLCRAYDDYGLGSDDFCGDCLVKKATGHNCLRSISKARDANSLRPVFDLIRKVRKWVEAQ